MRGYTNIKADEFCCTGAVLEAILIRNNYKKYSQYDIINEFGLTVPKTAKVFVFVSLLRFSRSLSLPK